MSKKKHFTYTHLNSGNLVKLNEMADIVYEGGGETGPDISQEDWDALLARVEALESEIHVPSGPTE